MFEQAAEGSKEKSVEKYSIESEAITSTPVARPL